MKTKNDIEKENLRKELRAAKKQIKSLSSKLKTSNLKHQKCKSENSKLKSELKKKVPQPIKNHQTKLIETLLKIVTDE